MPGEQRGLSPRLRKVLEDLAERMVPSGGPDYPGSRDVNLPDRIIGIARGIPRGVTGLKALLWIWELMPLFFFKFRTFSRLSPEAQINFLEQWEKSRIFVRRAALTALKALFTAPFYSDPHVQKKIGYAEDCLQPLERVVPAWSPEDEGR